MYVYHKQRFSHEYRRGIVVIFKGYIGRDLSLFLTYKGQRRVDLCTVITLPPFSSELSSRQSTGKVFHRVGLFTFQSKDTRTPEQFTIVLLSTAASYPASYSVLILDPENARSSNPFPISLDNCRIEHSSLNSSKMTLLRQDPN